MSAVTNPLFLPGEHVNQEVAQHLQDKNVHGRVLVLRSRLHFRFTRLSEVYRCCARIGYGIRGGVFFCGLAAKYVADIDGGRVIGLCGNGSHVPANPVWKPEHPRFSDPNVCLCEATEENPCCFCDA